MRISDWSSDVCSSDLAAANRLSAAIAEIGAAAEALFDADRAFCSEWLERHGNTGHGASRRSEERRVGEECVRRVDLGGRRIIKKKKKQNITTLHIAVSVSTL